MSQLVRQEISLKELENLTKFASQLRSMGKIDERQYNLFLHAIVAGDDKGDLWTCGAQTGKWYRRDDDRWVEGQPPDSLILVIPKGKLREAEAIMAEFKAEVDLKVASFKRCPACRARIVEGARFCTSCGKSLAPVCPACGTEVTPEHAFCTKCGKKLR